MPITPITPTGPSAPNTLTPDAAGAVAVPNTLTPDAAGAVAVPNTLTPDAAGAVAVPNTLTPDAAGTVAAPNTLSADAAGTVAAPNTLSADAAGTIAAPISLPSVTAAAFPRSLTPMVDFDFAAKSYAKDGVAVAFDDIFTYTRASSATFTNRRLKKNGGYEYFLDNDYVGSVTNLLKYSEDFSDTTLWATNGAIITNAAIAPDGTLSADHLQETSISSAHGKFQGFDITAGTYTRSIYAKAAERSWFYVKQYDGVSNFGAWFNLTAGTVGTVQAGMTAAMEPAGDGWFKCSITNTTSASTERAQYGVATNNGAFSYVGTAGLGVYIWGAQFTESTKPLPYVKTLDVAVTKTFAETLRTEYDAVTGKNLGALIEGGSTNTMTYSEEISAWYPYNGGGLQTLNITDNYGLAPDNTMSASRLSGSLVDTTSNSRIIMVRPSVTGSNITLSFWVKSLNGNYDAQFHFKGQAQGTVSMTSEWKRVSISGVTVNATENFGIDLKGSFVSSLDFDFLIWGAQVENKQFASSYIRTEGAAVSRSKDKLSLPASTLLKNLPITVNAKFDTYQGTTPATQRHLFRDDGTVPRIRAYIETSGSSITASAGSDAVSFGVTDSLFNGELTIVGTDSTLATYTDKTLVQSKANTTPWRSDLTGATYIGSSGGEATLFGHISKFSTYAQALTAQEITLL